MTKHQELFQATFSHLSPKYDFVLAPLTYMKIGGPAEIFVEVSEEADLKRLITFCKEQNIPVRIIGGASNVIISDKGLTGVTIGLSNSNYVIDKEKNIIRASAGFRTALLVRKTVDDGFTGLEHFLGVPGKLGGAIYNNAHYLADLIGQYVYRVHVIDDQGNSRWLSHDECHFAYDYSIFHEMKAVIFEVEFQLTKGDRENSLQLIKAATEYRAKTQPLGEFSSGCYFRNTPNIDALRSLFPQYAERKEFPTAFLIDHAGLKNTKVGGVHVSQKHAAFFINDGTGSSEDVKQLATVIKQRVHEQYGVQLQEEVFFLE